MNQDNNSKFLRLIKKILCVIRPRFSFHYVSYTVLVFMVVFSVVHLVTATTPNPGHPWIEVGDGVFQVTNNQTAVRTYTFPDANATVLTTNALVTVPQGGTGVGSFTSNGILYGNGTGNLQVTAAGTTGQCLTGNTSSAPSWASCGTPSIGGSITGGTLGSVLFVNPSGTFAQDNSNFFWDDTTNRLGIGTSSPSEKLDVNGNIFLTNSGTNRTINWGTGFGADALRLYDGGAGDRYGWGLQPSEVQFFLPASAGTRHYSWNIGGDLQPSGTNELMRLTDDGKLIIGATSGTEKLTVGGGGNIHIVGSGLTPGYITWGQTYGGDALRLYDGGAGDRYGWGLQPGNMQFHIPSSGSQFFSFNGGGDLQTAGINEVMRIMGSGNVAIGNITASSLFSVGSSEQFKINSSGAITSAAGITSSGTITFSGLGGSGTKCLQTDNSGVISAAASACGSGGGLTVGTTAIASGTPGRILFEGSGNVLQESANLFWDQTNSNLALVSANSTGVTTSASLSLVANSLTTGTGFYLGSSSLSSGSLIDLAITGTAALTNQKGLNISLSGANGTSGQTTYGAYVSNTHTGTSSTNIGFYATASGATNNYAAIFDSGRVGIGTTAPTGTLSLNSAQPASVGSGNGVAAIPILNVLSNAGKGGDTSDSSGFASGGNGAGITLTGGQGGAITGTPGTGIGGNGGNITIDAGVGGQGTNFGGVGGNLNITGGTGGIATSGSAGTPGYVALKGGNAAATGNNPGADVYLVGGIPSGSGLSGNIILGVSPSLVTRGFTGIGTFLPSYRLDVLQDYNGNAQTASNRVANFSNAGSIFNTTSGALTSYSGYLSSTSTRSTGGNNLTNVGLYATASGAQNNYAAIFENGNVGIGTTTPGQKLSVYQADSSLTTNGTFLSYVRQESTWNTTSGAKTQYGLVVDNRASISSGANPLTNVGVLLTTIGGTNNYALLVDVNAGNVGIGDLTPAALFTVGASDAFQINSSGAITSAAGITSSGTITFSGLGGSGTKCLQTDNSGVISAAASACGSGGGLTVGTTAIASGGANRVLFENGSNILSESADFTYDGTTLGVATASTTLSNKSLNISQTGATIGTDYAGFFSNTGAATTNVGLYATASGGTTNIGLNVDSGQTLLGGTTLSTGTLAKLNIVSTMASTGSTTAIAGIHGDYTFNNGGTASYVQVGNRFVFNNAPTTNSNTMVGEVIRTIDNTTLANLVRGIEIVSNAGSNTAGTNTGLRSTGATFGVQAITSGLAGGVAIPAGLYAENTGTTQGDVARFYSGSMTSAPSMLNIYHDTSTFTGAGLLMDMAVSIGTFSGNFAEFKNASVTKFKVTSAGVVSMGLSGTASTNAVCSSLANATAPTAGTSYEIRDCNAAPAADYAEMYSVENGVEFGDIVATGTEIINTYDSTDGNVDWNKIKGKITRLVKSNKSYQNNVVGIVVDNYGDFTSAGHNIKETDNPMPVALNGRVPVKVSQASPSIDPGDYVTTSDEQGKGTKAKKGGFVIGKALETWTPNSSQATVMIYVEQGFYNGVGVSEFAGIDPMTTDFTKRVLSHFMENQASQVQSELVLDRLAVGLEIITPKLVADKVEVNTISTGTGESIGLLLGPSGKFIISSGGTQDTNPVITFDSLGNANFTGKVTASEIEVSSLAGIEIITDQINNLSEGQAVFALTTQVINTLSSALTIAQGDIVKLKQDVEVLQGNISGLTMADADLDTRLKLVEAFLTRDEAGVPKGIATVGLTVSGDGTFMGKAQFDGLSFFSNTASFTGGVTFAGRTEFTIPPLYNKDSAGYALIKQGDIRAKILFTQPYIKTPVVNTSVTFEAEDNIDDKTANILFTEDIRFIVVGKDQSGFTILLNKPAPRDMRFSWNALSVKDPTIFESVFEGLIIQPDLTQNENSDNNNPVTVEQTPDLNETQTSDQVPIPNDAPTLNEVPIIDEIPTPDSSQV